MSTEEVAQDVSQVTDFHYHSCRKFRIFSPAHTTTSDSVGQNVRNRLASSSQLGITFALVSNHQLLCFPTANLLSRKATRDNMNVEVTDFEVKTVALSNVEFVNDLGINADGTLLAVLHTRNNDVSVDVYDVKTLCSSSGPFKPLCTTRVGSDQVNQGSCLQWNPAFPDTFAAASTDRSIVVTKINPSNPSNQKLIGIGKLGAITTVISWSPKGKQLTIGDSLGKIVQLKPELDVVRSQFGPEHSPSYGKVTGLCWLATTEWLVSFERGNDHDAYLMRCKKDKPTEWIQYHELSYASSKWTLPPQLFPETSLLVDWNVVIVANSRTSEIATVGKREEWQTWVPVEGEGIYLPTTESGKDTIPVGIAVDRSMKESVMLKPDGPQIHRPSPLVMCLTNDGILTAHHVISTFAPHNPCQIASQNISISGLAKLNLETSPAATSTTPPSSTNFFSPPEPSKPVADPSKKPIEQTPKAGGSILFGSSGTSATTGTSPMFGATKPSAVTTTPAALPLPSTPKVSAFSPVVPKSPVTPVKEQEEEKRAEQIEMKKKVLIERVVQLNKIMGSTKDSVMKMSFAVGRVKNSVSECAEVVKSSLGDSKEVMDELKSLISSIERMSERTQHTVKEMDFEIDEKMELVSGVEDGQRVLEKLRNMSETEKMMRFNKLETSADLLNGKFEECCDKMKKLRAKIVEKESLRKQATLSPLRHNSDLKNLRSGVETEVALKVMRNVSRIIVDIRERIQLSELDFARLQREKSLAGSASATHSKPSIHKPMEMSVLDGDAPRRAALSDAEIVKARQALVTRIQRKGPVKTRNVTIESYSNPQNHKNPKKMDKIDTSSLSNAILKLSMTPRRVMPSSIIETVQTPAKMSDAATQADEPPVVKTVVVTVESPAKPMAPPPIVSTPKTVPTTTTTQKIEKPLNPVVPSPSSSIFSGSLFGSAKNQTPPPQPKTPTAATGGIFGKSSLLGSTVSISPEIEKKEESEKEPIVEEPKETKEKEAETKVKETEEPKKKEEGGPKIEEIKETPAVTSSSAEKVEEKKVEEEKKVDETQTARTASFSFTTPKTPSTGTSIFGGGLKPQTPGSGSIFGGGAKTPITATNPSSIFGGGAKPIGGTTTGGATPGSSIFGGGVSKPASPFGSFGAGSQATPTTTTATAPSSASTVSFSFNTGSSTTPAKPTGFFGAATATAKPSSVFGGGVTSSPSVPNVDDGMEDDSINGGGPGGNGGGGFMSGLGGSTSNSGGGANPFAPKTTGGGTNSSSWLFGGAANQGQQQQQKPSFSFTNPSSPPSSSTQSATPSTATSSVFGGGPKFGSGPVFGGAPKPFGSSSTAAPGLSKNASIFGGALSSSSNASGGFAQFAGGSGGGSVFGGGGGAAQPSQSNSIFGGGAQTQNAPSSSIFGGGSSANANKPSSFTSWR